ncbi:hypothetical protein [Candidatus Viridilinea mediisalina]|uniref:Uncharacterized protein n=1 Tax=Candidatus Viridilinea mediisalina TaxID=2024553 RepID=A0A2A6RPH2_9CHLR|nr:hypothetical protein [Candidatus Viridilinea mediisalina]PDW04801.1 hypothetical protein CJ255_01800 [Candidatus Viridilinea mediisalina]
MDLQLTTLAQATPGRMLAFAPDGSLRLIWDEATIRIALFDLSHLANLLDDWAQEEELPLLRRGYYRIEPAPNGGLQLWLNNIGLNLSRAELRTLTSLIEAAEARLSCLGEMVRARPFGPGFRKLGAPQAKSLWLN